MWQARYSKPILASRDAKASSKEQENGALAMESLHRQTLPFLLRRMKEDVLKDLPPKITQVCWLELQPELGNSNWASTGSIRIVHSDKINLTTPLSADWKSSSSNVSDKFEFWSVGIEV